MHPRSSLLALPRELRNKIYEYYVTVPGGYKLDFHRNKLTTMDDKPVELRFMYTCTLVADEMRGLALGHNTITFSTVYSDELRMLAGHFEYVLRKLYVHKELMLRKYVRILTDENANRIAEMLKSCPDLIAPLSQATLRILSQIPDFDDPGTTSRQELTSGEDIASADWAPWTIPDEKELERMTIVVYGDYAHQVLEFWSQTPDRSKWRFSATAAAIRFLGSISKLHRDSVRRILLLEDHEGVAYQECHAFGLIPFCKENPHLRVERRVNLWRNIFLKCDGDQWSFYRRVMAVGEVKTNGVEAIKAPEVIASWLQDTLRLIPDGMPSGAFKLTVDGESASEKSCEIFQIVQKHAAWKMAPEDAWNRKVGNIDSSGIPMSVEENNREQENRGPLELPWIGLHESDSIYGVEVHPEVPLPSMQQIREENVLWDEEYDQMKCVREQEEEYQLLVRLYDVEADMEEEKFYSPPWKLVGYRTTKH
ncbi:hypothetical protein DM02DRAFT_659358 [Periconia macrospinosa]|uniref:Uncharacterized protein n=1 Tax=Periconia macrospinosa TaxID=97972 RepID=A0A2V1DDZ3_9PLEO|nr:hypothetical protein DM02DRAFT_659358 [Periconia macrospinosa]